MRRPQRDTIEPFALTQRCPKGAKHRLQRCGTGVAWCDGPACLTQPRNNCGSRRQQND